MNPLLHLLIVGWASGLLIVTRQRSTNEVLREALRTVAWTMLILGLAALSVTLLERCGR